MNRFTKKLLAMTLLLSMVSEAWADRGAGRRTRTNTVLNIATPSTIKNSIAFNIKSGLNYKGSLINTRQTVGSSIMNTSLVTYQKGNTTYIVPYKNKITVTEMRQGYTGVKVIIRSKK